MTPRHSRTNRVPGFSEIGGAGLTAPRLGGSAAGLWLVLRSLAGQKRPPFLPGGCFDCSGEITFGKLSLGGSMTMMIRGIAAWLLAMVLLASAAHAHGGVGMVDKRCVLRIGPDIMFFTGYQPQNSRDEFCYDIPSTGQMVVALDMQEPYVSMVGLQSET